MTVGRDTLTKVNGSLLSATFSGNVELTRMPESQRVFLDRDPEVFNQVIQHLRNDMKFAPNYNHNNGFEEKKLPLDLEIDFWQLNEPMVDDQAMA